MKAVTLRNIPPRVANLIRRRAAENDISINRAVLSLLEESLGLAEPSSSSKTPEYHDLDNLAGSWSEEEAASFEEVLAEQRKIDPDLWR